MAPPYGRKWRGIKEPVDEGKRRMEKVGLKLNTQKTEIMSSGPITSWQIDGGKMETVMDFIFLASKITMDVDYSHETKNTFSLKEKQCQTARAY